MFFIKSVDSSSRRTGGKAESMQPDVGRWVDVVVGAYGSFLLMASIFSVYKKQGHHGSERLKVENRRCKIIPFQQSKRMNGLGKYNMIAGQLKGSSRDE